MAAHVLHSPVDEAHATHPMASDLDAQQRPPKQKALVHLSPSEQDLPAAFFGEHLDSASG